MMTSNECRVMKALFCVCCVKDGEPGMSDVVVFHKNGNVVRECFFHPSKWDVVTVTIPPEKKDADVDEAYCGIANGFFGSYFHYMAETLPKIYQYSVAGLECPMILTHRNKFVDELLGILGVPLEKVVPLCPCTMYHVGKMHYVPYQQIHEPIGPDMVALYSIIRDRVGLDGGEARSVYLSRKDVQDLENNNMLVGKGRFVTNEAEIVAKLGFEELAVGSMTFAEKAKALRGVEVVVTPFGSNILNLVLSKSLKRVVILCTKKHMYCLDFFKRLLEAVCKGVEVSFVFGRHTEDGDPNMTPYVVSVDEVKV